MMFANSVHSIIIIVKLQWQTLHPLSLLHGADGCVCVCVCMCVCVCVFCVEENQERGAGIEWRLYMVPALAFEYLSPYLFL